MINFVLSEFEATLKDIGLYKAIRNIQYGLLQSAYHLYNVLEMYNFKSGTFFTLVGELGLTLHEMFEVSLLLIEELPYKKIILTIQELRWLKKKYP